jgi:hypothetical protein
VVSAGSKALPAGHAHSSMPPGSGFPWLPMSVSASTTSRRPACRSHP